MKNTQDNSEDVSEVISDYTNYIRNQGLAYNTVRGYESDIRLFCKWFSETTGEEATPDRVTAIDLRDYQGHLQTRGYKPGTINRKMRSLRGWLAWAVDTGIAPRVPTFPQMIQEVQQAPQSLERNEMNRLLRELERQGTDRDRALVRLLLSCGLRVSEAVRLQQSDITLGERSGTVIIRDGKGRKYREVPVPAEARNALRDWVAANNNEWVWVFPGRHNKDHLTENAAWRVVKKYAHFSRLPDLHPHTLRHTCATNMIRAGVDISIVSMILGHSRLDTTAIYTRPSAADMAAAAERGEV